jgi:hypothetical protein
MIRWLSTVWVLRTRTVLRAFDAHDPSRRLLVRYEELLEDTQGELGRIAGTLGLEIPRGSVAEAAKALDIDRVAAGERGDGKEIRAADPGGWQENLSREEREAMLEIVGPTLRELGYMSRPAQVPAAAA